MAKLPLLTFNLIDIDRMKRNPSLFKLLLCFTSIAFVLFKGLNPGKASNVDFDSNKQLPSTRERLCYLEFANLVNPDNAKTFLKKIHEHHSYKEIEEKLNIKENTLNTLELENGISPLIEKSLKIALAKKEGSLLGVNFEYFLAHEKYIKAVELIKEDLAQLKLTCPDTDSDDIRSLLKGISEKISDLTLTKVLSVSIKLLRSFLGGKIINSPTIEKSLKTVLDNPEKSFNDDIKYKVFFKEEEARLRKTRQWRELISEGLKQLNLTEEALGLDNARAFLKHLHVDYRISYISMENILNIDSPVLSEFTAGTDIDFPIIESLKKALVKGKGVFMGVDYNSFFFKRNDLIPKSKEADVKKIISPITVTKSSLNEIGLTDADLAQNNIRSFLKYLNEDCGITYQSMEKELNKKNTLNRFIKHEKKSNSIQRAFKRSLVKNKGNFMSINYKKFLETREPNIAKSSQKKKTASLSKKRPAPKQFDGFFLTPDGPDALDDVIQMSSSYPRKKPRYLSDGFRMTTQPSKNLEERTLEGDEDIHRIPVSLTQEAPPQFPISSSFEVLGLGLYPWEEENLFGRLNPPRCVESDENDFMQLQPEYHLRII